MDFKALQERLMYTGYLSEPRKVHIRIPNAEDLLRRGLNYFTSNKAVWIEQNYRPIVEWMTDNKGKGLLMMGGCGLGKSLIGMRILPLIINAFCRKIVNCYDAQDLNVKPDDVLQKHLVYIDDIGTEGISNIYGNKRIPFSELCDAAEKKGKLLIITTNLDVSSLSEKYGESTIDRLRAVTKLVPFFGDSLRK